jgi:hypothetical protein
MWWITQGANVMDNRNDVAIFSYFYKLTKIKYSTRILQQELWWFIEYLNCIRILVIMQDALPLMWYPCSDTLIHSLGKGFSSFVWTYRMGNFLTIIHWKMEVMVEIEATGTIVCSIGMLLIIFVLSVVITTDVYDWCGHVGGREQWSTRLYLADAWQAGKGRRCCLAVLLAVLI